MAPPNKPVVGELYSPIEQSEIHGGTPFRCAPSKDGWVLLLRVKPRLNPDRLASSTGRRPTTRGLRRSKSRTARCRCTSFGARTRGSIWDGSESRAWQPMPQHSPSAGNVPAFRSATRSIWKGVDLSDGLRGLRPFLALLSDSPRGGPCGRRRRYRHCVGERRLRQQDYTSTSRSRRFEETSRTRVFDGT